MKTNTHGRILTACMAFAFLVVHFAQAANFTWLASPASANWNTSDANWSGAGSVWVNDPANYAYFGASTVKTITAEAVAPGRIYFTDNGYTISGGPLWVTGDRIDVASGCSALVSATVTNSATLYKMNPGTLVLNPGADGTNRFNTLSANAGLLHIAGGTHIINGGGINAGFTIYGGAVLVSGGMVRQTHSGFSSCAIGSLTITNGMVDLSASQEFLNAQNGEATTTVSGAGVLDVKLFRIAQSATGNGGVVNVNTGGTVRLERFNIDSINAVPKGTVSMNGGTVEAKADTENFLGMTATFTDTDLDKWLTNIFVYVRTGGAIFNTAGKNIGIKQPLYTGDAVDGGLKKRGLGTLTLFNTNTYNGLTVVENGTLKFGRDNLLPAANTVMVSSNAVLDVNGKTLTLSGLGGGGTVTNLAALTVTGTLAPGDDGAFGMLTLAEAPASIAGCTLSVDVSDDGASDRLHVQGDLDLSTLSLSVENTNQLDKYQRYTIASCTGALGIPFNAVSPLPTNWQVKYSTANKTAYLVYNLGTLIKVH